MLAHLGYPLYLGVILGAWRIPGAATLVAPGFARLKEWAYAGTVFNYTGAAASHFLAGDRAIQWFSPLVLAALTLVSWKLRPPSRSLPIAPSVRKMRLESWIFSLSLIVAMLLIAFLNLPTGAPQS
jgi:hypothetical protein